MAFAPAALGAASSADVAGPNYTWTGASTGSSNWTDAGNWGGSAPSGSVGTLDFPLLSQPCTGACYAATDDVSGLSANELELDPDGTYNLGPDAGSDPLSLGAGGLDVQTGNQAVSGASATITVPVDLTASQSWTIETESQEPVTLGPVSDATDADADTLAVELEAGTPLRLGTATEVGPVSFSGYGSVQLGSGDSVNGTDGQPVSIDDATLAVPTGTAQSGPLTIDQGTLQLGSPTSSGLGQLDVAGNLNLTNAYLSLELPSSGGTCPAPGDVLTLVTATGTVSGTFDGAPNGQSIGLECNGRYMSATIDYTGSAVTATVPKDSTMTEASCSPETVVSGNATTCTATVTDDSIYPSAPGGTVTFSTPSVGGSFGSGGATCTLAAAGASSASCSTTFTPTSTSYVPATLSLTYNGDAAHTTSQGTAYMDIEPPASTYLSLLCSPAEDPIGSTATCVATASSEGIGSAPTGTVTLTSVPSIAELAGTNACTLAATSEITSACRIAVTPAAAGNYTLSAAYGGDSSHLASSAKSTLEVANPTGTQLSCEPTSLAAGATTTCSASVTDTSGSSPSTPTGEVTFSVPRKWSTTPECKLSPGATAGTASCQLTLTPSSGGKFTVAAIYEGDSGHLPSTGRATLTVTGGSTGTGSTKPVSGPPGTQCADPYPSASNPANRLMLPTAPGSDPLSGASFFVNGPAHGFAAGAIARLLGIDSHTPIDSALPGVPETESWAVFAATIPVLEAKLGNNANIDHQVAMLEKIAAEPETQRLSSFSQGGGPGALYSQTQKLFCHNFLADPTAVPIISTYFLHPVLGGCASASQIRKYGPTFRRRVDEVAEGTGNRPAVFLVEIDGIGSSSCMAHRGDLGLWLADIRYEDLKLMSLPHTLVYVEGGYSDSNSPAYTARALKQVAINKISGFWTNDTHINWTIHEINWGEKVSRLTGGAHFVVNTAQNGNGPLLNPHPTTQGVEDLCNPPGRALGPQPTTSTGYPHVDAFIWSAPPGMSGGSCNGGTPSGTFWTARAVALAAAANDRLGPTSPSHPY